METVQDIQLERIPVPEPTPEPPKNKGGRPPGSKNRIVTDTNRPTSGSVEPVTLGGADAIGEDLEKEWQEKSLSQALEEEFGTVLDISQENLTYGYQSLGKFAPPKSFDLQKYAACYGIEDAGALDGWTSVSELLQPSEHMGVGKVLPAWKVWKNEKGQPHKVDLGKTKAVLCYQPRVNTDTLEKAFGQKSKDEIKGIYHKIGQFNKNLPSDVENAFRSEEEFVMGEIQRSSQ